MKLELDHDHVRTMLQMWRKAVDLEIPLASDIRVHFLARRGHLLDGFVTLARNWLMLLHSCNATGNDVLALVRIPALVSTCSGTPDRGVQCS
ncbi:hypothetical protein [Hydrogenophaga sp. ANAO-22]|uniref:hypothetical protein n=1 Tax=Hydrogenophaga sp. ANAO-22 TaxID=3166645 RepID=UPI0036D26967